MLPSSFSASSLAVEFMLLASVGHFSHDVRNRSWEAVLQEKGKRQAGHRFIKVAAAFRKFVERISNLYSLHPT